MSGVDIVQQGFRMQPDEDAAMARLAKATAAARLAGGERETLMEILVRRGFAHDAD